MASGTVAETTHHSTLRRVRGVGGTVGHVPLGQESTGEGESGEGERKGQEEPCGVHGGSRAQLGEGRREGMGGTDGWMERRVCAMGWRDRGTDRWMDGWMDGRKDRMTDKQIISEIDAWMNGQLDRGMEQKTDK